jgi:tRNA threonylcarbamoyladenosine biosynthesis protein TsaB
VTSRILAIDTTAEFGSIALGGEEILLHAPDGFGGVIFEHIERLLQRMSLRLDDLDGFAAASGPGSFTGVRIGLACVKGLAEGTGKAAFGVSNLEALARFGAGDRRVPVIDARRGEVYAALYGATGGAIIPEMVCRFPALLEQLPEQSVEFISQDFGPFAASVAGTRFGESTVVTAPRALAAVVARIAEERLAAGETGDPAGLDANYVRRSDAELLFKPW